MAQILKPKKTRKSVDKYLDRGLNGLETAEVNPRLFFRIFTRQNGAIAGGHEEFFYSLASLIGAELAKKCIIYALPEGTTIEGAKTSVITMEGPANPLLANETLLYYLTTGTRAMTLGENYKQYSDKIIFMGARDQSEEEQAIFARAFERNGIPTTIEEWSDRPVGTMSHSQITAAGAYRLTDEIERLISAETDNERVAATIRATIVFALGNPGVPVYVLGDYATRSYGCFETFRATYNVCKKLGIEVKGGRMDISKSDLNDAPIVDKLIAAAFDKAIEIGNRLGAFYSKGHNKSVCQEFQGMSLESIRATREALDEAGMEDFEVIVSSGMKLERIQEYLKAGAAKVGIGEDAVYFLNKGECNYTSDAVGFIQNGNLVPFNKEGRELSRLVDEDELKRAGSGFKIDPRMVRINLADYL